MSETSKNPSKSRRRGRPPGASRLNEADMAVLRKVASLAYDQPDAPFAPLVRTSMPWASKTDQRRLREKWLNHEQELLDREKAKRGELGLLPMLFALTEAIGRWVDDMAKTPTVERLRRAATHAVEGADTLNRLGAVPQPPFDVKDPDAVDAVIARFERDALKSSEDLIDTIPKDMMASELPGSIHHYLRAVIHYELYLQAKATEDEAEQQAVRDTSSDDHRAGGSHG